MRRTIWLAILCFMISVVASGCAPFWSTATPSPVVSTPGPAPANTRPAIRAVTSTPLPVARRDTTATATPQLATFTITDAPIQSWTDPNNVTALLHDGSYLWTTTNGGLVRWNVDTGEYRLFTSADGLASQAIRGLARDSDGHLWIGYLDNPTWSEYDGQAWHTYSTPEEAVEARYTALLAPSTSGRGCLDPRLWSVRAQGTWTWLLTADGRAKAYDGKQWRAFGASEGMAPGSRFILAADDQFVWAIGDNLNLTEEGLRRWEDHNLFSGVPAGSTVTDVVADTQGRVWLAFAGPSEHLTGGLACYDPQTGRWLGYRQSYNPAIPGQIYALAVDDQGMLWIAGDGGLAYRRPDGPWEALPIDGLVVRSFCRDDKGRLWLGTDHGLWSIKPDGSDLQGPWLIPSPLVGNQVTCLATDGQQRLWIGTTRGTSYVVGSGDTGIAMDEPALHMAAAPDGSIWLATTSGLYHLIQGQVPEHVLEDVVTAMTIDAQGTLWVCTGDGQLRKWSGTDWETLAQVTRGIDALPVDLAVGGDGRVWFATAQGLGVWAPTGEFSLLGVDEGLPNQDVRALALGPDDALWIATAHGLARVLPSGKWTRFTTESTEGGLRAVELWDLHMDSKGTLWVATSAGISSRTPDADWSFVDLAGARIIQAQPEGALWVGTRGGLYRIDRSLLTSVP